MSGAGLVALACCDLGAIVRGRSVPAGELERHLATGIGWVPANHALTPIGTLAEPNPFGSTGDLRLVPDLSTRAKVDGSGGHTALELVLCDLVELDGSPWSCCPRGFLRGALELLEDRLGGRVVASFEHEFQLLDPAAPALAFSLEAQRRSEPFASELMDALKQAGVEPERFFPEYAPHQFEVPLAPAEGIASADRSVVFREVVRELARRHHLRASFTPLLDPAEAGNGVHVHLNLIDADGRSLLYDAAHPAGLSETGLRFAAGVLRHAPALSAITAPSPVSGARLQPHRWSGGAVCLGLRNRETLLRIPPLVGFGGAEPERDLHLEYRGADASANPYLVLGALIHAGLAGIGDGLPAPEILDRDPSQLSPAEAERFGVGTLPATLDQALAALERDAHARAWMGTLLYEAYVSVKRAEADAAAGTDLDHNCERYAAIY